MAVEIPTLSQSTGMAVPGTYGIAVPGTYTIAAGLLILLALAGAVFWSQVEIEIVRVERST